MRHGFLVILLFLVGFAFSILVLSSKRSMLLDQDDGKRDFYLKRDIERKRMTFKEDASRKRWFHCSLNVLFCLACFRNDRLTGLMGHLSQSESENRTTTARKGKETFETTSRDEEKLKRKFHIERVKIIFYWLSRSFPFSAIRSSTFGKIKIYSYMR